MNKLVLSLLLSVVAGSALGMQPSIMPYDQKLELDKQYTLRFNTVFYSLAGIIITPCIGYFGSQMWSKYLKYAKECPQSSIATNALNTTQKSNWAPYAKIAAGLGLTGLTAYLGMKQQAQPQTMKINFKASNDASAGNTLSPTMMISLGSAYTLAPMIPAYFFLKSGFEDLKKNS
ncbi:hypothetical protein BH09DEP1_BH09DEP1_3550 [soil metagenome]